MAKESQDRVPRLLGPLLWCIATASALWFYARHAYGLELGPRYVVPSLEGGAFWRGPLHPIILLILVVVSVGLMTAAALPRARVSDAGTFGEG